MEVKVLSDIKNFSREANFELLRVIAMIMVTMLHTLGHGGVLEAYEFGSARYIAMWFIETLSYVSVNLFVLITGYFMVNSNFKISRIIKLSVQVEFYSLICLIIAKFVLKQEINIEDIVSALFPLTGGIYWFASAYAVLIALSPLLNKFIHSMSKNEHFLACISLCTIFCVIPTFLFWSRGILSSGSDFAWFIVLYISAAYIKLYSEDTLYLNCKRKSYFIIYIILCSLCVLSRLFIGQICKITFGTIKGSGLFYSYNSILIFVASVCLFMFFRTLEIKNNKIISKIAVGLGSVCFGAYLCSDNPFLRKPLWDFVNLPQMAKNVNRGGTVLLIAVVLIIFLIGCIIEWIRVRIFKALRIYKLLNKFDIFTEKIVDKIKMFSRDMM